MTFENHTRGELGHESDAPQAKKTGLKNAKGKKPHSKKTVGLSGGQHEEDEGGLDISKYTGPESQDSTELNDPEAPYGTGPGNGLRDKKKG